jgi:outer membrane immunogenic protein
MRSVAITMAAIVAAATTPAFAAAEAGPYVGIAVTHDNVGGTGDLEGLGLNGVGGSVFAGYNLDLASNVFAGLEANFDLASADRELYGYKVEADHAYGISGRLGYRLSPGAALYGRVGYQRGRATVNDGTTEEHFGEDGLRLGAGVEANLNARVAVRVEYNHTQYYVDDSGLGGLDAGLANNQAAIGVVFGF